MILNIHKVEQSEARLPSLSVRLKATICGSAMIACGIATMGASSAYAQESTATPTIDEIIVTSERRSKNLQRVPLAVTALTAEDLSDQQITTTLDLAKSVPNLVTGNNVGLGSAVIYFLRGVGNTESIPTFDLPIGTYIDEVYISRQNSNQIALSGVERVEVLRGPQGTLFGRNTTGGAISIVTEKPSDEFGGNVELGIGSFSRLHGTAALNVPLSDKAALRVSGMFVEDDGYLENENNDETFNGESTYGGRAALRVDFSDSVNWNASAQYIETDILAIGTPEVLNASFAGTREPVTGDLLVARIDDENCKPTGEVSTWAGQGCTFNETTSTLLTSNLQIGFDAGTLNLITGYYENDLAYNIDFLGNTNQPVFGGLLGSSFYISNQSENEQFSQEIKWTGSAFSDRLDYVAGLFYMNEKNETEFTDTALGFALTIRDPLLNDTESMAAFLQGDFSISDRLTLQAGMRYTDEEKTLSLSGSALNFGSFAYDPLNDATLTAAGVPLKQTVSKVTPRVALFYDIDDEISVYGSYTEGFKSGGWNVRGSNAIELQPFGEETVESFELGFRSQFLDNRIRFNATAFHATYDDFQVPTVFPGSSNFLTLNSGVAKVSGIEVDFLAAVTEGLEVFGNFGLMDSEYLELSTGAVGSGIGPELQRTPDFTGRIGAAQTFMLNGGSKLRFGGDISYISDYEVDPANSPNASVEGQALVSLQASWTAPNEALRLILECSNCTDEVYLVQNLFNLQYASQPRRIGLRAKVDF